MWAVVGKKMGVMTIRDRRRRRNRRTTATAIIVACGWRLTTVFGEFSMNRR